MFDVKKMPNEPILSQPPHNTPTTLFIPFSDNFSRVSTYSEPTTRVIDNNVYFHSPPRISDPICMKNPIFGDF